jgi:AbrB family looped-hinge helix DNA binding protein
MQEFEATVTAKGQITIPQKIRRIMGLQPHDKVRFEVVGDTISIRRVSSKLLQWFGSATPMEKPEDLSKVREAFEKAVAEEVVSEQQ